MQSLQKEKSEAEVQEQFNSDQDKLEEELISKFVNIDLENTPEEDELKPVKPPQEDFKNKSIQAILSTDILAIYSEVGSLMQRYRSGKLPKPLRVVTMLSFFDKLLEFMQFTQWSTHGILAAFELWMPSLKAYRMEILWDKFLQTIIRSDYTKNNMLSHHIQQLLVKSTQKPLGFIKCFIQRLIKERQFSFKESIVQCSVLKKMSIHNTYASSLLFKLTEELSLNNHSASWNILKTFVEKKYHLPVEVVERMCLLWAKFVDFEGKPNIQFQQSLLSFCQQQKQSIKADYVSRLKSMLDRHKHPINAEIKRELNAALKNSEELKTTTVDIKGLKDDMEL